MSLDALAQAAKEAGIRVKRSQNPSYPAEGRGEVAADAQLGHARDKDFVQKNRGRQLLHRATGGLDDGSRTDELGPVVPRTFPPAAAVCGWAPHKAPLDYERGPEKPGSTGSYAYAMARC